MLECQIISPSPLIMFFTWFVQKLLFRCLSHINSRILDIYYLKLAVPVTIPNFPLR